MPLMLNKFCLRLLAFGLLAGLITGCHRESASPPAPPPAALSGQVLAGDQALADAEVVVYAATRGQPAQRLLSTRTDAAGRFALSASDLQAADQALLLVEVAGGDSGSGQNPASRLLSVPGIYCAHGDCGLPAALVINPLTTVASAYSLAGWLDEPAQITGSTALERAAQTSALLVDPATGAISEALAASCSGPTVAANCQTLQKINTLANRLSACLQTPAHCAALSTQTAASGDTLQAVLALAQQAASRQNGAGVFTLASSGYYQPELASAPNDWTLALQHTGGGLNAPAGIAVDARGQIWISNSVGSLSRLDPQGRALSPAAGITGNGLNGPLGIAIDSQNQVWVANWAQGGGASLSRFLADGSAAGAPITAGSALSGPIDLAIAADDSLWVANYSNSTISQFAADGRLLRGPIANNALNFPSALALDHWGQVWVVNLSGNTLSQFAADGQPLAAYAGGGLAQPYALAIDSQNDVWISNQLGHSVSHWRGGTTPAASCPTSPASGDTGCPLTVSTGGGLKNPVGVAVDGADHVWVSNFHGASLSELAVDGTLLSPASGYQGPGLTQPYGLAIDDAGNLWVANYAGASVTEFIGIATPVITPKKPR